MSGSPDSSIDTSGSDEALREASALADQGRLGEAVERCEAILARRPRCVEALHLAGLCHFERGDLGAALERLTSALHEAPNSPQLYCNLGLVQRARGETTAARASCERALELAPSFAQAHYNLGVIAFDAGAYAEAEAHYRAAVAAQPTFREAHYNRAHALQQLGREESAIEAYRRAVEVAPDYSAAWLNLANGLHAARQWDEALSSYRRYLELEPDSPSAAHMVAAIEGTTTDRCPCEFVADLFDSYASEFDEVLIDDLGYRTPGELARLVAEDDPERRFGRVLDLGCGTGLVAEALRARGRHFVGVDLSPRMIAEARGRGVYDELVQADLVEYLAASAHPFDLIVAADVFVYLGDLRACLQAAAGALAPGGRFAFSTEASEREGFTLQRTGRYAHHRRYVESLAERFRLALQAHRYGLLRYDHGEPVEGHLFLLSSPPA